MFWLPQYLYFSLKLISSLCFSFSFKPTMLFWGVSSYVCQTLTSHQSHCQFQTLCQYGTKKSKLELCIIYIVYSILKLLSPSCAQVIVGPMVTFPRISKTTYSQSPDSAHSSCESPIHSRSLFEFLDCGCLTYINFKNSWVHLY